MKKSKLIAKLSNIVGDPDIVITDLVRNANSGDASASADGVYTEFKVEHRKNINSPETISISFETKGI